MTTAKFAKHLRFNSNQRKTNSGMHLSVFLLRLHMQGGMINWRIWLTVDVAEPAVWASPQLSLWLRQNGVCVCVCVIASFASSGGDALQAITVLCIICSALTRVCWADDLQRNKLLRWAQQFCGTISIVLADVCASWNFVHDRATSSPRGMHSPQYRSRYIQHKFNKVVLPIAAAAADTFKSAEYLRVVWRRKWRRVASFLKRCEILIGCDVGIICIPLHPDSTHPRSNRMLAINVSLLYMAWLKYGTATMDAMDVSNGVWGLCMDDVCCPWVGELRRKECSSYIMYEWNVSYLFLLVLFLLFKYV